MRAHSFRGSSVVAALAAAGISALPWCSGAWAQTDLKVSLNAPYDGSNAAFFLAEDKGYYAAEGLKLDIRSLRRARARLSHASAAAPMILASATSTC